MNLYHLATYFPAYRDHLACYQTLQENQTLATCFHIYGSLMPLLNQLTAFQFYCLPDHTITKSAVRSVKKYEFDTFKVNNVMMYASS